MVPTRPPATVTVPDTVVVVGWMVVAVMEL